MKTCSIEGCKTTIKEEGIKMHGIPKGNIDEQWVHQIKQFQPDFQPTKYSVICSKHFVESAYFEGGIYGKNVLDKSALPIINKNLFLSENNDVVEVFPDNLSKTCLSDDECQLDKQDTQCMIPKQMVFKDSDESINSSIIDTPMPIKS
ncbi:THAP domain-containing protein 1-like, partial [Acyrthosiphon pisum]|uniref:THAP-type domain-containing protein n=1 Tax=Acyrthosiphon pisum TaxID=7029 RepID=A0A8R2BAK8_ACYPI